MIFEITVFRYFFQNAVELELFYRFTFLLFPREEDIAIKSDVPGSNERNLFPSFPKVSGWKVLRCYHEEVLALKDVFLRNSVHIETSVFCHTKRLLPRFSDISIPIGASTGCC